MNSQLPTTVQPATPVFTVDTIQEMVAPVIQQVEAVNYLLQNVLKEGTHYGTIPGVDKPTLYKAGAEKMATMANLAPAFEREFKDSEDGHREVISFCTLIHRVSGEVFATNVAGSCSTYESKYRFRFYDTGNRLPDDYRDRKAFYKSQGFRAKKIDNVWQWQEKRENDNPHEERNTVIKMADKRSYVAAVLFATGTSDFFTQDVEDMPQFSRSSSQVDASHQHDPRAQQHHVSNTQSNKSSNDDQRKAGTQTNGNGDAKTPKTAKAYAEAKQKLTDSLLGHKQAYDTQECSAEELINYFWRAWLWVEQWGNKNHREEILEMLSVFRETLAAEGLVFPDYNEKS